jgi:hypothetical protein
MVELGTRSLHTKVHPKKINCNRKKNSTVIDREFGSLSLTVEFFDLRIFFRCAFVCKLLLAKSIKATVQIVTMTSLTN